MNTVSLNYLKALYEHDSLVLTNRKVYPKLFEDWDYLPLWWNCHDFAIRLAFLIAGKEALHLLRWIMTRLSKILKSEVEKWDYRFTSGAVVGWGGCATTILLEAGLGVVCPPLALGAWSLGFFSGVAATIHSTKNKGKWWEQKERMTALEKKFPQLTQLHKNVL